MGNTFQKPKENKKYSSESKSHSKSDPIGHTKSDQTVQTKSDPIGQTKSDQTVSALCDPISLSYEKKTMNEVARLLSYPFPVTLSSSLLGVINVYLDPYYKSFRGTFPDPYEFMYGHILSKGPTASQITSVIFPGVNISQAAYTLHNSSYADSNKTSHTISILIVGDLMVGKSAALNKLANSNFRKDLLDIMNYEYRPTIGVDFKVFNTYLNGQYSKIQMWDTAGNPRFRTITSVYYVGAHGIIAFFDVYNRESFQRLKNEFQNDIINRMNENATVIILGNHRTTISQERQVSYHEACEYSKQVNWPYFEVDVTLDINENGCIYLPVLMLISEIIKKKQQQIVISPPEKAT
jgi:small GTP-binding protein